MTATTTHESVELIKRPQEAPVVKHKPKGGEDKGVTMAQLLAAFALYKSTLNHGVITQSTTMDILFKSQNASMKLAAEQVKKMLPEMEKAASDSNTAGILSKVGMVLGIVGMICMFIPGGQLIGAALLVASGACMIAAGAMQIKAGEEIDKVADKKGTMMKDQAEVKSVSTSANGLSTQLNNTVGSKTQLEQVINAIINSFGKSLQSAGPQQQYARAS